MEYGVTAISTIIAGMILAVLLWLKTTLNYWKRLGVPGPKPTFLVGNMGPLSFGQLSFIEICHKMYAMWKKERYFGFFNSHVPILMVTDPDLINQIMVKDHNVFPGRGIYLNDKDPLSDNLFSMYGPKWKIFKSRLTPVFTLGKIKNMIPSMVECGDRLEKYLLSQVGKANVLECSSFAIKYAMDVIIACEFSVTINEIYQDGNKFQVIGRRLFETSFFNLMKQMMSVVMPNIYKFLGLRILSDEQSTFFINFVKKTIELREKEKVVRDDIIDILIDMKNNRQDFDFELTDSLLASQAFVIFVAGFEGPSAAISFALYELALFPETQEKLRSEIFETLKKHNGQLSYEAINEMKHLNMVIHETLRKNPPNPLIIRKSDQPYKLPGSNVVLPAGTLITIPTFSIHHDEKYFPDPELFNPERFRNGRKPSIAYSPFGEGPRSCMGVKFSIYQIAVGLISVLKQFKISPSNLLEVPYKLNKNGFLLSVAGGINLKFEPLTS